MIGESTLWDRRYWRQRIHRLCDEQWVGDHLNAEQAAESVLVQFKRMIDRDLALLEIRRLGTE